MIASRLSLSNRLQALSKICMDSAITNDECATELVRCLDDARADIRAVRGAGVPRLPPEIIAVIWRWLDVRGTEAFALCDRVAFDLAFAFYHGCTRATHMARVVESRDKRRKNEMWIRNELRNRFAATNDAYVVYGVRGSTHLDEVVNMDAIATQPNEQRQRVFVIFEPTVDVDKIQIPLEGIDKFSCLCLARCALIARHRTSPFERCGVLRIMGMRSIWWTELAPCATLRL